MTPAMRSATVHEVKMGSENGNDLARQAARAFLRKPYRALMHFVSAKKFNGEDRAGWSQSELEPKRICGLAWQRNRTRCATESSLGPDSSERPSSAARSVRCFADAGAVSATALAKTSRRIR
jgi:hypothetical protein